MSEELLKAIASAFKINADEWIATLKDGDDWLSEDVIKGEVSKLISEKVTAAKTQSRKSGQAEQNAKVLKFVKTAGFENPDGLQGDELLTAFNAWKDEQTVPQTGDTPPDQMDKETLSKLPIVKSLILEARQESGKGNEALKAEFAQYKAQVEQEKTKYQEEKILERLERYTGEAARNGKVTLKVDGLKNAETERISSIYDTLRLRHKVGLNQKGELIALGEDGNQLENGYGEPVPLSEIIVAIGEARYGLSTQDPTHEGANPPQNGSHGQNGAYVPKYRFKDQAEYDKFKMETVDGAERLEATKSWQFAQEKAAGN
jgi:hypothetical protein